MAARPPFASVYFDCDSTLSAIEGIDELMAGLPADTRRELVELTQRAMEGAIPLAQVYQQRLAAIAPRRDQLAEIGERYAQRMTPDADLVVAALQSLGKRVGVVSGGLLVPVLALSQKLGVDERDVHAVPLRFDAAGSYVDFDRTCPLWQNGGKVTLLRSLPAACRPLAFVGDGATDLETQGAGADLFVGFGGVAIRPVVKQRAETWFETPSLAPLLRIVLTADELRRLESDSRFRPLLARAKNGS
jgi:phosphoserine phosphatase